MTLLESHLITQAAVQITPALTSLFQIFRFILLIKSYHNTSTVNHAIFIVAVKKMQLFDNCVTGSHRYLDRYADRLSIKEKKEPFLLIA